MQRIVDAMINLMPAMAYALHELDAKKSAHGQSIYWAVILRGFSNKVNLGRKSHEQMGWLTMTEDSLLSICRSVSWDRSAGDFSLPLRLKANKLVKTRKMH